jgi:type I restriction enzyme, S subunit
MKELDSEKELLIKWVGKAPDKWDVKKLKHCFKVKNGKEITNNESETEFEKPIDVYGSGGIFKKTNNELYDGESVLFGRKGTIGKPIYVSGKFWTVDTMYYTEFKNNMVPRYFYYLLCIFPWELITTKTALPSVVGTDVENFDCIIPNYIEQLMISKTSEIDSLIADKEKLIELLDEKCQAIITEAVTKGLNPYVEMKDSGVELLGVIPTHWDIRRLNYLGTLQNGISKSSDEFGFGYPFVSYGDVYKNVQLPDKVVGLVNSTASDRDIYSVRKGDVFFTRTSETIEEIGIASTCLQTIEDATFAGFLIRFRPTSNRLVTNFAKYFFRSDLGREYFVKEMNLVTRASLSQDLLKKFPVTLPPIEEQQQIASYLDFKTENIYESIALLQSQIDKLKEYRQSLIYEAVTGKIDVREYKKLLS